MKYKMNIAGLDRELPLCKVSDDLYIGAFIMFGDAEITVACARELLARAPKDYDYLLTAEAKSIPLIHEMARQSGAREYFVARKGLTSSPPASRCTRWKSWSKRQAAPSPAAWPSSQRATPRTAKTSSTSANSPSLTPTAPSKADT